MSNSRSNLGESSSESEEDGDGGCSESDEKVSRQAATGTGKDTMKKVVKNLKKKAKGKGKAKGNMVEGSNNEDKRDMAENAIEVQRHVSCG